MVTAAGGFYSFVTHGFGTVVGMGTAALISSLLRDLLRGGPRRAGLLRVDERRRVVRHRHPGMGVHADLPAIISASRGSTSSSREDPRCLPRGRGAGLLVFGFAVAVEGGADGLSLAPLNPAEMFNNSAAVKAFGAGAVGMRCSARSGRGSGFEMAPNYAEESTRPQAHRGDRDVHVGHRPGGLVRLHLVDVRHGLGPAGRGGRRRAAVQRRHRIGVLPADRPVRGLRADDDLRGPHRHRLVRVHAGLLQHVVAVLLLHGPRGHPARASWARCTRRTAARTWRACSSPGASPSTRGRSRSRIRRPWMPC